MMRKMSSLAQFRDRRKKGTPSFVSMFISLCIVADFIAFITTVHETPRSPTSLDLYTGVSLDFKSMMQPQEVYIVFSIPGDCSAGLQPANCFLPVKTLRISNVNKYCFCSWLSTCTRRVQIRMSFWGSDIVKDEMKPHAYLWSLQKFPLSLSHGLPVDPVIQLLCTSMHAVPGMLLGTQDTTINGIDMLLALRDSWRRQEVNNQKLHKNADGAKCWKKMKQRQRFWPPRFLCLECPVPTSTPAQSPVLPLLNSCSFFKPPFK